MIAPCDANAVLKGAQNRLFDVTSTTLLPVSQLYAVWQLRFIGLLSRHDEAKHKRARLPVEGGGTRD